MKSISARGNLIRWFGMSNIFIKILPLPAIMVLLFTACPGYMPGNSSLSSSSSSSITGGSSSAGSSSSYYYGNTGAPLITALLLVNAADGTPIIEQINLSSNNITITDAAVSLNGTNIIYNPANNCYTASNLITGGSPVTLSVTVTGTNYTVSGNQFTAIPSITLPAAGSSWGTNTTNIISWSWSGGSQTNWASWVVGVATPGLQFWLFGYSSSLPCEIPSSIFSTNVPDSIFANLQNYDDLNVLVGIISAGFSTMTGTSPSGGIQINNAYPGSAMWLGEATVFPIEVTNPIYYDNTYFKVKSTR
jgi:hypothetical protein